MKKILMLAFNLNPRLGSECGHANAWLRFLAKHYPFEVVTDQIHRADIERETYENVTFHFVPVSRLTHKISHALNPMLAYREFYRGARPVIARLIARGDIALVYCQTPHGVYAYNDAYRFGVSVVAGPVNGGLPTPPGFGPVFRDQAIRTFFRDLYYRYFMGGRAWAEYFIRCRKILISTHDVLDSLPPAARPRAEVLFDVVVNVDLFQPPEQTRPDRHPVRILFAGGLEANKGCRLLLEAVRVLKSRGVEDFEVAIAGRGRLADKLRAWSEQHGLADRIKFLGLIPRQDLVRTYQTSDVFCFPTLREPGGNVVLEAMACGLPVITSDYGGPAHSVTPACGIKIPVTDFSSYVRELSRALERLIRERDTRLALGRAGRDRAVREFSRQAVEAKVLEVFRELLP